MNRSPNIYIFKIMFINSSSEDTLASSIYYFPDQPGAGVKISDLQCFRKPVIAWRLLFWCFWYVSD